MPIDLMGVCLFMGQIQAVSLEANLHMVNSKAHSHTNMYTSMYQYIKYINSDK